MADLWWNGRPPRDARARREQKRRKSGRQLQDVVKNLHALGNHRGCRRSKLGEALYSVLASGCSAGRVFQEADAGIATSNHVGDGNVAQPVETSAPVAPHDDDVPHTTLATPLTPRHDATAKACRSLDGEGVVPVVPLVDPMVFGGGSKDSLVVAAKACRSLDGDGVAPVVPLVDPLAAADTVRRPLGDSSKDSSVVAAKVCRKRPLDGGGVEPVVPHVDPLVVADKFCRPFGGGGEDPSVVEAMDCRPTGGGGVDQVVEQDSSVGEKASRSLDGGGAEQDVPRVDPLVAADTACRPVVGKYAFGCGGADTWENTPDKGTNAELTAAVEKLSEAFLKAKRLQRQLVIEGAALWIGSCVKHVQGIIGEGIGIIKSLQK